MFAKQIWTMFILAVFFVSGCTLQTILPVTEPDSQSRADLFAETSAALKSAENIHAERYAPEVYARGVYLYNAARKDLGAGKKLEPIYQSLAQALIYLKQAEKTAFQSQTVFEKAEDARIDAINAKADQIKPEEFEKAQKLIDRGIRIMEDGRVDKAIVIAQKAEKIYQESELTAIKHFKLGRVWDLLKQADISNAQKYAPEALKKAQEQARLAEMAIEKNRYDNVEIPKIILQAEYEASHSIYLANRVRHAQERKMTMENLFVEMEEPLNEIADALGAAIGFSQGVDMAVENIVSVAQRLRNECSTMTSSAYTCESELRKLADVNRKKKQLLNKKEERIAEYETQVASLEKKVAELTQTVSSKIHKAEELNARMQKVESLRSFLDPDQSQILIDSSGKVTIRLTGLKFSSGRSSIKPRYFKLLSNVRRVISEFPENKIIIEGHTDSKGSDEDNRKLSSQRAASVKKYLINGSNISGSHIDIIGYGESRPIADNKTRKGQKQNRRIDIVIEDRK